MPLGYRHPPRHDRCQIQALKKSGLSKQAIAAQTGRAQSVVSRESAKIRVARLFSRLKPCPAMGVETDDPLPSPASAVPPSRPGRCFPCRGSRPGPGQPGSAPPSHRGPTGKPLSPASRRTPQMASGNPICGGTGQWGRPAPAGLRLDPLSGSQWIFGFGS